MTPEILAYLRNEPSDYAPTRLARIVHHWRDRLQTEDARAALVDDLAIEASTATDSQIDAALTAWAGEALTAWLAFAGAQDADALQNIVAEAMATDNLTGWAAAHDALGACGVTTVAELVDGKQARALCFSAARLAVYDSAEGPPDADGNPTTLRVLREHAATVAGLQASLRGVLVGLCG